MKWFVILFLAMTVLISCDSSDDANPGADGDDDTTDDGSADDDTGDHDTGDDDTDYVELPPCAPFEEGPEWLTWGDFDYQNMLEAREQDAGYIIAAVTLTDDGFIVSKDDFSVNAYWNTDTPLPVTDDQTVYYWYSDSAGDDGCCDSDSTYIYNESLELLIADTWNENLFNRKLGDITLTTQSEHESVCRWDGDDGPSHGDPDWIMENGISVEGTIGDSHFYIPEPASFGKSDDDLFAVNWPIGYEGISVDEWDTEWWFISTKLEIIRADGAGLEEDAKPSDDSGDGAVCF